MKVTGKTEFFVDIGAACSALTWLVGPYPSVDCTAAGGGRQSKVGDLHLSLASQVLWWKESACNAGDTGNNGSIPGLGRSPGEGSNNLLQYSYLEFPWTEKPGGLESMGSQRIGHD